ncbi:hypothetical protein D3C72_1919870 [compost metagenome]
MKLHVPLPLPNKASRSRLPEPTLPVSVMLGNKAARAAPILAFMARKLCSADCTSGRCNKTLEGKPSGTGNKARLCVSATASVCAVGSKCSATPPPTSNCSALRSRATWEVKAATSARAVSTVERFCASTKPEVEPISNMR